MTTRLVRCCRLRSAVHCPPCSRCARSTSRIRGWKAARNSRCHCCCCCDEWTRWNRLAADCRSARCSRRQNARTHCSRFRDWCWCCCCWAAAANLRDGRCSDRSVRYGDRRPNATTIEADPGPARWRSGFRCLAVNCDLRCSRSAPGDCSPDRTADLAPSARDRLARSQSHSGSTGRFPGGYCSPLGRIHFWSLNPWWCSGNWPLAPNCGCWIPSNCSSCSPRWWCPGERRSA